MIIYVPKDYFDKEINIIEGSTVSMLGLGDYAIFDENGRLKNKLTPLKLVTRFSSQPYKITKEMDVKLTKSCPPRDYMLLHYKKGDPVIVSTKVPQDISNVENFLSLFLIGQLPNTIPYDEIQNYFIDGMEAAGESFKMNYQMIGVVISEMYRNPKNLEEPFRNSNYSDKTAYTPVNIREIPGLSSPYAALTNENKDNTVVSAMMVKNRKISPMEKLLMEDALDGQ